MVRAIELLNGAASWPASELPEQLPEIGLGDLEAVEFLAPLVIERAAMLGSPTAFAHMDPPTPWVTWATGLWNARLNQNLLHPATAPFASMAEQRAIGWLSPGLGMDGGHMTSGSTLSNLTGLWAARDLTGARRVIASDAAHLSVKKSAHILGMEFVPVATDHRQRMREDCLPDNLSQDVLVLTAGTTGSGVIDALQLAGRAAWTHVDAAWAGPLVYSDRYGSLLDGIANADSIAISAHKWLFQPKEAALIFFKETAHAHAALAFGGSYLAKPNIGVLGSHGASAVSLLAMLMAWGRRGLADRLELCMANAEKLATWLNDEPEFELLDRPETGVIVFRPRLASVEKILSHLPPGLASTTQLAGDTWMRCVSSNPNADIAAITSALEYAATF